MTSGSTTVSFEYDASGMRTEKTVGNKTWQYVYNGSTLSYMTDGTNELYFSYDSAGPLSVSYNGTEYYYVLNAQGDVIALVNSSGSEVVSYTYDPWGKLLSVGGSMASALGQHNPLRYRGYVYDTETGLYYLQTRYYNPELCRFINADELASTGQGILGYNMFAYCLNNPINYFDPMGTDCICLYERVHGNHVCKDEFINYYDYLLKRKKKGNNYTFNQDDLYNESMKVYEDVSKNQVHDWYDTISAPDFEAQSFNLLSVITPLMNEPYGTIVDTGVEMYEGFNELSGYSRSSACYDADGRILYIEEGYTIAVFDRVYIGDGYSASECEYYVFDRSYEIVYNDTVRISYFVD